MTKELNNIKSFFLLTVAIASCCASSFGQNSFINPRGTFEYVSKTVIKNGDTYGYFGTIQVKTISNNKIVMTFYICKGATSYNSGSFIDTLDYRNNMAIYKDEECITTFVFTNKGIDVKETSKGDCWGANVYAHGHFRKKSSKQPILVDPLSGEK
jgi:hypothetical protein